MAALITLIVVAGIVGIIAGIAFLSYKIMCWCDDRLDAKRKKAHPDLYRWFDEAHEKGGECIRWYNNEIAPRKRQVDAILRDWNYYTAEEREQKEKELEELRNRIYLANITDRVLEEEKKAICDKIRKYVADNNLEWAKKWGW